MLLGKSSLEKPQTIIQKKKTWNGQWTQGSTAGPISFFLCSPSCPPLSASLPHATNSLLPCQLGSLCSGLNPPLSKLCLASISVEMLSTYTLCNFSYCTHEHQLIASILRVQLERKRSLVQKLHSLLSPPKQCPAPLSHKERESPIL